MGVSPMVGRTRPTSLVLERRQHERSGLSLAPNKECFALADAAAHPRRIGRHAAQLIRRLILIRIEVKCCAADHTIAGDRSEMIRRR
jgi:hypothetical protein